MHSNLLVASTFALFFLMKRYRGSKKKKEKKNKGEKRRAVRRGSLSHEHSPVPLAPSHGSRPRILRSQPRVRLELIGQLDPSSNPSSNSWNIF